MTPRSDPPGTRAWHPGRDATPGREGRRYRIAWVEESTSLVARAILPYLAQRHEVTYVTAEADAIPAADFVRVVRARPRRYVKMAAFELCRHVNGLYRSGLIDIATVMSSTGFALRGVPFINLETTSVYAQFRLFTSRLPLYRGLQFLPGFVHYAIPEMVCNRSATRVIAPSQALKSDILRLHGLPAGQVAVVPHGVEDGHMALFDKKAWGAQARVLFVGRLHYPKGIAAVLREFVRRPDVAVEFLVVGDGPDRSQIEAMAARDPRVKILGQVSRSRIEQLLATTDLFAFPTFYEACSLALLEAMASGHACVCYDVPATREALDGSGVLVPLGDAARLVEEIARLARDPAKVATLSSRAHRRAAHYSWDDARACIDRIICDTVASLQRQ